MSSLVNLSLDDREFFKSLAGRHFLSSCALESSPSFSLRDSINKAIEVIFFLKAYRLSRESQGVLSVFSRLFSSTSTAAEKGFYEKYSESSVKAFSFEDKASFIQDFIWLMAQAKADGRHEGEFFSALRSMLKFLPVSVAEHFHGLEGRPRPFLMDLNEVKKEFGVDTVVTSSAEDGLEMTRSSVPSDSSTALLVTAGAGVGAADLSSILYSDADSDVVEGPETPFSTSPLSSPLFSPSAADRKLERNSFAFSAEALAGGHAPELSKPSPAEVEMVELKKS